MLERLRQEVLSTSASLTLVPSGMFLTQMHGALTECCKSSALIIYFFVKCLRVKCKFNISSRSSSSSSSLSSLLFVKQISSSTSCLLVLSVRSCFKSGYSQKCMTFCLVSSFLLPNESAQLSLCTSVATKKHKQFFWIISTGQPRNVSLNKDILFSPRISITDYRDRRCTSIIQTNCAICIWNAITLRRRRVR